jgi:hypothetical protein
MFSVSTLRFYTEEEEERLLEPSCLPPPLTVDAYSDFLGNVLPELLQDADLQASSQL